MNIYEFGIGVLLFLLFSSVMVFYWSCTVKYHKLYGVTDEVKPSSDDEKIERFFEENPNLPFVDIKDSRNVDIDGDISLEELRALVRLMESLESDAFKQ